MKVFIKIIALLLCLAALFFVMKARVDQATLITEPFSTSAPSQSSLPAFASEAPRPTSSDAPAPEQTAEPTPTPEPQPELFTLSFVGDCTLWSNQNYAQHPAGYAGVIGEDYSYPFSNTVQYFENDEYTFANLECILSEKQLTYDYTVTLFPFIAPKEYANIMLEGGVDFVTTANNHMMDCYEAGANATYATLEEYGLPYGKECQSQLVTTPNGLTIGIYTAGHNMRPDWKTDTAVDAIRSMREQGADLVVCMFHWGDELYYKPYEYQTKLAHACIDAGADIIYGSHSHCLQPIEEYNGKLIFYSMGNWTFGGHTTPSDPDTAIIQVTVKRDLDGSVSLDGHTIIPCCVSSNIDAAQNKTQNYNDYRPTPYEEGTDPYYRVLSKLDGSFEPTSQGVDYSNWYASRATS